MDTNLWYSTGSFLLPPLDSSSTHTVKVACIGTKQGQAACLCSPLPRVSARSGWEGDGRQWPFSYIREVVGSCAWIPGSVWRTSWSQMWSTLLKGLKSCIHPTMDVQDVVFDLPCSSLHTLGVGRRQSAGGGWSAQEGPWGTWNKRVVEVMVAQGWDLGQDDME